jgi:YVTN family beta-propeller protein
MVCKFAILLSSAVFTVWAEPGLVTLSNPPASAAPLSPDSVAKSLNADQRAEQVRNKCIEGRRFIAGRVVQVTPDGLVVDSGYSQLLSPPFNHSWVVSGTASVDRDAHAVESKRPDAVCVGLVFLSNIPKRPPVKIYDYVVIHGYPAGDHVYVPVPGVEKTVRRFSASLERAVELNLGPPEFEICVSNERSGDITVLDGATWKVVATVPVGKRPRGIIASPDGKTVYVALSGTPISGPPQLDAQGNPILHKGGDDDDDDDKKADKSADGIAVVDLFSRKFQRKLHVGSDPEQFALSKDGTRLYVSNEDVATASILNVGTGKVEQIVPVHREPEGVGTSPDGRFFYVTCENDGEIFAVDAQRYEMVAHFNVGGRPRSIDFLPDGTRAFIPSESAGEVHLIDTAKNTVLKTVTLPKGYRPMCLKVAPNGQRVYVSTGRAGSICVLDPANLAILNTIKVGQRPWGIAFSPDAKCLFSANGPSDDVSVVDLESQKEVARVKAGQSPWGLVVVPKHRSE